MAVYTEISTNEAGELLRQLGLGQLTKLEGCSGGIENTNYFATSDVSEHVLTVFERLSFEQLPYYLHLMKHLASKGIPVPNPAPDAVGNILHSLQGKPACVVNKLRGKSELAPRQRTAPKWARCWRACTWRAKTTSECNPICAPCRGGTRPCLSFCLF